MSAMKVKAILIFTLASLFLFLSCGGGGNRQALKMATTTSTDNTGLLDYLAPHIKRDLSLDLQLIAVGTGKALELGKNCDVDILLVHAPDDEKKFIAAGSGINRTEIMYNDFVIIGPDRDPAGIKGKSVAEFMRTISSKKIPFISRGDGSGTNKMELTLWKKYGTRAPDRETWYIQTGQGMLPTINIAAERSAYTLTDRGTYIKYEANNRGNPPLKILIEGDPFLINQYSIIEVNPAKCAGAASALSKKLTRWFTSAGARKLIKEFTVMGKQLFFPGTAR